MNRKFNLFYESGKGMSFGDFIIVCVLWEAFIVLMWYGFLLLVGLVSPRPPPGSVISPILIALLLSSLFLVYFLLEIDSKNTIENTERGKRMFIVSRLFFMLILLYYPFSEGVYFVRLENIIIIPFIYIYIYIIKFIDKNIRLKRQH